MTPKKQIVLLLALVAAAAAVWYAETRPPARQATAGVWNLNFPPLAVDNPQLHWWKAEAARKTDYARSRRNIFSAIAPPPEEEKKSEMAKQPPLPAVPAQPTVAPLPVKFFGYATLPSNGTKRAFFTDGDDVFIVGEGEALFGRFRVVRIGNNSLEYEEIASGLHGTLTLEEAPQA